MIYAESGTLYSVYYNKSNGYPDVQEDDNKNPEKHIISKILEDKTIKYINGDNEFGIIHKDSELWVLFDKFHNNIEKYNINEEFDESHTVHEFNILEKQIFGNGDFLMVKVLNNDDNNNKIQSVYIYGSYIIVQYPNSLYAMGFTECKLFGNKYYEKNGENKLLIANIENIKYIKIHDEIILILTSNKQLYKYENNKLDLFVDSFDVINFSIMHIMDGYCQDIYLGSVYMKDNGEVYIDNKLFVKNEEIIFFYDSVISSRY